MADFITEINNLLQGLGFVKVAGDDYLIEFCVRKITEECKNACNIPDIPDGLKKCASGLMLAEFLNMKKGMGQLEGFSFSFEPALKQLMEGDTNIEYATSNTESPEQRFTAFLAFLNAGRGQFASYRRVKW